MNYTSQTQPESTSQSLDHPTGMQMKPRKAWKIIAILGAVFALIVLLAGVATFIWYGQQLTALDSNNSEQKKIIIQAGSSPKMIAEQLKEENVIRSSLAFGWYVRMEGIENKLQAGTYRLGSNMSVQTIAEHLASGKTDAFTITFYPGATLRDTTATTEAKKTDVTTILTRAGYTKAEVDEALAAKYDHPLLASKPTDADLEGYVYGETYTLPSSASAKEVLEYTFDQMYAVVQQENLVQKYKKQGLTLHEGIILSSVVQREVSDPKDQPKIASVFYNRLKENMNLGSDVTYQYIADKTGVPRDPGLQSEYNTRIHTGLPPGPIAAPGASALMAVAEPIKSDYLFFLSGDDDVTYFGRTVEEHEQNKKKYCQKKCLIL